MNTESNTPNMELSKLLPDSYLLENLASFRRDLSSLLYNLYVDKNEYILKCLKNIQIKLENLEEVIPVDNEIIIKAAHILQNISEHSVSNYSKVYTIIIIQYEKLQNILSCLYLLILNINIYYPLLFLV